MVVRSVEDEEGSDRIMGEVGAREDEEEQGIALKD